MRVLTYMLAGTVALSGCSSGRIPNSAAHVQPQVAQPVPAPMVLQSDPSATQGQNQRVIRTTPLYTPGVPQPDPLSAVSSEIREADLQGHVLRAPDVVVTKPLAGEPGSGKNVGKTFPTAATVAGTSKAAGDPATSLAQDTLAAFGIKPAAQTAATQGTAAAGSAMIPQNTAATVQPQPVPQRSGSGPNVVEYAVSTTNPIGTRLYDRGSGGTSDRMGRKCGQFSSPDLAQQAFLAAGGPTKDSLGLDPDGDGFACMWDPAPFRRAVRG